MVGADGFIGVAEDSDPLVAGLVGEVTKLKEIGEERSFKGLGWSEEEEWAGDEDNMQGSEKGELTSLESVG